MNVEKEVNGIVEFIREYFKKNNLKGIVLGISGGKDSGVVAGLFAKAIGGENIVGLTLPCHSKDEDKTHAKLVADKYGFELLNLDLTNTFDTFKESLKEEIGEYSLEEQKNSDINLKPRLRMASIYYVAALMSAVRGGTYIVSGTSNKCELFVGYFTKGGDSVHDIAPIADFTVEEVIQIGEYLEVPEEVLYKTPNDGLSNQSDEDKLGVKYKDISSFIKDKNSIPKEIAEKIEKLHNNNLHKFNTPTYKKQEGE